MEENDKDFDCFQLIEFKKNLICSVKFIYNNLSETCNLILSEGHFVINESDLLTRVYRFKLTFLFNILLT